MNDTSVEMERVQFQIMQALGPDKRMAMASEMFMAARNMLLSSLPDDLSNKDRTRLYFEKMYGEPLPDDFFKDQE
jgi:hypothetical protein